MTCILIENGKAPDDLYNAVLGFWLPPDTPYGNFQLKFMKIVKRLDEANRRILESHNLWNLIKQNFNQILPINAFSRHVLANEQAVYMMRRAADELVSMIYCLSEYEKNGRYPGQIEVDAVGKVLAKFRKGLSIDIYQSHLYFLDNLNDISNAFKHSFVNSYLNRFGRDEPCVFALGLDQNHLKKGIRFHSLSMSDIVIRFNNFYGDSVDWLRAYSSRHLPRPNSDRQQIG